MMELIDFIKQVIARVLLYYCCNRFIQSSTSVNNIVFEVL